METVLIFQLVCTLVKRQLKAGEQVLGEVEMFILMDAIMNAYGLGPWLLIGAVCQHGFKGEQSMQQPWALGTQSALKSPGAHKWQQDPEITTREISHHKPLITSPLFTFQKTSNVVKNKTRFQWHLAPHEAVFTEDFFLLSLNCPSVATCF